MDATRHMPLYSIGQAFQFPSDINMKASRSTLEDPLLRQRIFNNITTRPPATSWQGHQQHIMARPPATYHDKGSNSLNFDRFTYRLTGIHSSSVHEAA
eukprot:1158613-Pelagomonas_calceolata.AAC.5